MGKPEDHRDSFRPRVAINGASRDGQYVLVRAIELAKSGAFSDVSALRAKIRREGFGFELDRHWGKGLKRQLKELIDAGGG